MRFIDQFNHIISASPVQQQARNLMKYGEEQDHFVNYFGVNYNDDKLVSVKLYFSFMTMPPDGLFDLFEVKDDMRKLIRENWTPVAPYSYLHQGLTFGLKCHVKDDRVVSNRYIHFRTPNFALGDPKFLHLNDEDKANYPGICIEHHEQMDELKKYYYITSAEGKSKILSDFGLSDVTSQSIIPLLEYTESDVEKKINIITGDSNSVTSILQKTGNEHITELNKHFYDQHQLYYFAPGFRHNSTTRAIYYLPKILFYSLGEVKTLSQFIKS